MKNIFSAPLLLLLMTPPASAFQDGETWQKVTSAEGRFNVLMPSKPDISTNDVKTAQGVLTLYTYAIGNNNGYFIATYGDYVIESSDKEATLNAVRDGMAKGGKGEMISEKKISLDEHPGREIVLKVMVENRDVRFKWRIFLVGRRLYQIGVGTAKVDAEPPDVAKFLLSFGLNK